MIMRSPFEHGNDLLKILRPKPDLYHPEMELEKKLLKDSGIDYDLVFIDFERWMMMVWKHLINPEGV